MEYRFWILIIKNKKNSVFIGGFKIFFKSLIAGRLHVYITLNQHTVYITPNQHTYMQNARIQKPW